jgi:hypothetical protein
VPGEPVTDLESVDLHATTPPGRWVATWIAPSEPGYYTVTYYAEGEDPLGTRLVATPKAQEILVIHPTNVHIPWHLFL